MNKEIKEIIGLNCEEEIEVKYFAKDDSLAYKTMDYSELLDYITNLQEENERLNNIIEKTESMLKRLMEEQEHCYKKYPENWEERTSISNTWLTSRDCYWSTLNYLKKLKGSE